MLDLVDHGPDARTVQADAAPVAKTFAVVLINFTNLATQPWTKATVASAVTGVAPSLKTFYEEESKGRMTVGATVYRLVHDRRERPPAATGGRGTRSAGTPRPPPGST